MKNRKPIHDNWETPEYLLDYIRDKYFDGKDFFDPCPINPSFDGLKIDWKERNYVNPPYNRRDKEAFIRKAFEEYKKGKHVVMLLPVSTSTKIFHEIILPYARVEFLRGRVKFKGVNSRGEYVTNRCGQHDSMIVEFKPIVEDI